VRGGLPGPQLQSEERRAESKDGRRQGSPAGDAVLVDLVVGADGPIRWYDDQRRLRSHLLTALCLTAEAAISCYTCSSRNGSDINCEDPFHPAMSDFKVACMVPKEGHIGKFPANFCVKVTGLTCESLFLRHLPLVAALPVGQRCAGSMAARSGVAPPETLIGHFWNGAVKRSRTKRPL